MRSGCTASVAPSALISILSSDTGIYRALRQTKPQKHSDRLYPRDRSALPYIEHSRALPPLLLDTTVYIDQLNGRLSSAVDTDLRSASLWHSTVTECELVTLTGLLDPSHPDTSTVLKQVIASVERRPPHRIVNPDLTAWREAGILAGLLARLQQYGKAERRRALNDALIFVSAANAGLTVLTRNVADYDLLMQLAPRGKVLFYDLAS